MDINSNLSSVKKTDDTQQEHSVSTAELQKTAGAVVAQHATATVSLVVNSTVKNKNNYKKPHLSGNNKSDGKEKEYKKTTVAETSCYEIFAKIQDYFFSEQADKYKNSAAINKKQYSCIMTDKQISVMNKRIDELSIMVDNHMDNLSDYYYGEFKCPEGVGGYLDYPGNMDKDFLAKFDKETKEKFISVAKDEKLKGALVTDKMATKSFKEYLVEKLDIANVHRTLFNKEKTSEEKIKAVSELLNNFSELPSENSAAGKKWMAALGNAQSELRYLHSQVELYSSMAAYCEQVANSNLNNNSNDRYENELAVIMAKLSDLREKMMQSKMESEIRVQRLQQLALQAKTEKEAADIEIKIKEAEELQALFKWLAPLIAFILLILAALTAGTMTAFIVALIFTAIMVIDAILDSLGKDGIMSTLMTPFTKLMEEIQQFIKSIALESARAEGKSEKEIKELEMKMEIIAMVVAMVVMVALMSALSSLIGKMVGKFMSETVKQIVKEIMKEVQRAMIVMSVSNAVTGGINTILQAKIDKEITRRIADIEFDQQLIDSLTEMMNRLMESFSANQEELRTLNEKTSAMARDSFRNWKAILHTSV
ncbi:type III secretion system translocon subunit SctE [Morganella psychrotolerans]|uniref:Translocator protein BipB-like C-terminal domain-containing protein n=1 Tax=Morganella psychrotolerans TaxID=368603 RepID=A0A5M9R3C2_9GAMM|nr:type III secretion system translocon subunit SctE [Morganella psychrotolerans]KAA8715434.1 hypothetical protein F4V73_10685 [Morganella psychrotolerans]